MSKATTQRVSKEKRRNERVRTVLPVGVGGGGGTLRDVSASGMYLETDAEYTVGSTVNLELDLDMPWGRVMFRCQGKIVRRQPYDHKIGVAVQFIDGGAHSVE